MQVTVSWDTDADLDLHVADPTSHEVYFASRKVESGGVRFPRVDEHKSDNVRNERVSGVGSTRAGAPPRAGLLSGFSLFPT